MIVLERRMVNVSWMNEVYVMGMVLRRAIVTVMAMYWMNAEFAMVMALESVGMAVLSVMC